VVCYSQSWLPAYFLLRNHEHRVILNMLRNCLALVMDRGFEHEHTASCRMKLHLTLSRVCWTFFRGNFKTLILHKFPEVHTCKHLWPSPLWLFSVGNLKKEILTSWPVKHVTALRRRKSWKCVSPSVETSVTELLIWCIICKQWRNSAMKSFNTFLMNKYFLRDYM
jgi:hypothetical protein